MTSQQITDNLHEALNGLTVGWQMSWVSVVKDYQQAADDAGVIAETVATLGILLDRFHAHHGDELYERLQHAFPLAPQFGPQSAKFIYALERQLTSPEA